MEETSWLTRPKFIVDFSILEEQANWSWISLWFTYNSLVVYKLDIIVFIVNIMLKWSKNVAIKNFCCGCRPSKMNQLKPYFRSLFFIFYLSITQQLTPLIITKSINKLLFFFTSIIGSEKVQILGVYIENNKKFQST